MKWQYIDNQMWNACKNNYQRAMSLSSYHHAVLETTHNTNPDPDFATLYNRYHPLHETLRAEYSHWASKKGYKKSESYHIRLLFKDLAHHLNRWLPRIQTIYPKCTERHKAILPGLTKPFYQGAIDMRVAALSQLSMSLANEPALAAVKAEVDDYYAQLSLVRQKQYGAKSETKSRSKAVEKAIEAAMLMQHRNLGFLLNKWADQPHRIIPFFDLKTLRERDQRIYRGTLHPEQRHAVFTHTFQADDRLRLKAIGTAPLLVYLASAPLGTNSSAIEINPDQPLVIEVNQFNITDYSLHRFLTIHNPSADTTVKFLIRRY